MVREIGGAVVVLLLCLVWGCGKKEDAEITEITLLHGRGTMEEYDQRMQQIYMDFEKDNPDMNLKTREMLAVGNIPDIVFDGGKGKDSLYTFMVEHGYALDLMPCLQEDQSFADSVSPMILQEWSTQQGALYMVTDVLVPVGYWYNEQIFQNAGIHRIPTTWEEFHECCRQIQAWAEKEKLNTVCFHLDAETSMYLTEAFRRKCDKEEKDLDVSDKSFSDALTQLQELVSFGQVEDGSYTWRDRLQSFNVGHSAICVGGVWTEQMLHRNLKSNYALFPSENGESVSFLSAGCGYIVGKTGDVRKEEACIRFLKYILSKSVQSRILKETGQIPSNPQMKLDNYKFMHRRLLDAYQLVTEADHCYEIPTNVWQENQRKLFEENIAFYLHGEITLQQIQVIMEDSQVIGGGIGSEYQGPLRTAYRGQAFGRTVNCGF